MPNILLTLGKVKTPPRKTERANAPSMDIQRNTTQMAATC